MPTLRETGLVKHLPCYPAQTLPVVTRRRPLLHSRTNLGFKHLGFH